MKKFGARFIISLVVLAASIALVFFKLYVFAAVGCLIAFVLNGKELTAYSTLYQCINLRAQLLLLGYTVDCIIGEGNWFTLAGLIMPFAGAFRLEIFNFIGDGKYIIMDVIIILISQAIYIYANLLHPNRWEGWILPLLPLGFLTFVAFANAFTRRSYKRCGDNKEIGNPAPEFSLPDTNGNIVNMKDYFGKNHLLLIFVRGDWCPTCHIMIRAYETNIDKFKSKDIVPIGISPDPTDVNKAMMERLGFRNLLLTDKNQEIATKYGIMFKGNNAKTTYEEGIILPASFLVDKNGILRYMSRTDNAGEFLSPSLIFPIIDQLS